MWIVEIFRMSVDTSCDVLVYMTILLIVDFCIHEWINEMSILEFFVLWMDYFDTLVMYSFMLTLKPSRSLKIFISKQLYVVNLHSTVMALHFGDTQCAIRTSLIGWSQHQHLRLIRTHHLAQSAWLLLHWELIKEHVACVKCCVPINRKCWCCDWPFGDVLVPHRVPRKAVSSPQDRDYRDIHFST